MSKPDNLYEWATAPSATLEPSSDLKASGFVTGERPPARVHNWLWNGAHRWVKYLDQLHEEVQFLNKAYHFTNTFEVDGHLEAKSSFAVDGDSTFNGTVIVDTSVLSVSGSGGWFEVTNKALIAGLQSFSNITMNGPSEEVIYADAYGDPTQRTRVVMIPLQDGVLVDDTLGSASARLSGGRWVWTAAESVAFPMRIPHGGHISGMRVGVSYSGGDPDAEFFCEIRLTTADKASPASSGDADYATGGGVATVASGASHIFILGTVIGGTSIDTSTQSLWLKVNANKVGGNLWWVELTFTDPGPRNY